MGHAHTPLFTAATLLRLPSLQMPSHFSQILNFILQSFNLENTHTNNDIVRSRFSIWGNFLSTLFSMFHNYSYSSKIIVWKQAEHRLGLPLYTVHCVIISINSWLFCDRIILLRDFKSGFSYCLFCFPSGLSLYHWRRRSTLFFYFSLNYKKGWVYTAGLARRVCNWNIPVNHMATAHLFINEGLVVLPGSGWLIKFSLTMDCIIWKNKAPAKTSYIRNRFLV